jgi:outer membrane protein OmpA-like peptidoglycan-associated protein
MIFALLGISALAQASVPPPPPALTICDPFVVFFDFGSTKMTVGSQPIIDNIVSVKDQFRGPLTIVGHADAPGSPSYNRRMSMRRAEAVRSALSRKGMPSGDLVVIGLGETRPLVETSGAEVQNRRVEVSDCA